MVAVPFSEIEYILQFQNPAAYLFLHTESVDVRKGAWLVCDKSAHTRGKSTLTLEILVSVVNIMNSNPIPVRLEQNITRVCFHNSNMKIILVVDRG